MVLTGGRIKEIILFPPGYSASGVTIFYARSHCSLGFIMPAGYLAQAFVCSALVFAGFNILAVRRLAIMIVSPW